MPPFSCNYFGFYLQNVGQIGFMHHRNSEDMSPSKLLVIPKTGQGIGKYDKRGYISETN